MCKIKYTYFQDQTSGDLFSIVCILRHGPIVWLYQNCFLTRDSLFVRPIFCLWKASTLISLKRKEYNIEDCAKKAVLFFPTCKANPATRLSIPAAMQAKGYSDAKAVYCILVQQVCRESLKSKVKNTFCPQTGAAAAMLGRKQQMQ